MKKAKLTIAACTLVLAMSSCTKKSTTTTPATSSSSTTTTTPTSNDYPNTITIVDDGKTYTLSGGTPELGAAGAGVSCTVIKGGTGQAAIQLTGQGTGLNASFVPYPVKVTILSRYVGPATGIGTYADHDPSAGGTIGHITETYSGGQTYEIDSLNVNVTQCGGTNVVGTFWLHVTNTTASKTVTGSFNCPKASIQ